MTVFPPRSVHFNGKSIYGIWRSFGDAKMKWISHATVLGMDHELCMPPEWEKNWQFSFLQCVALLAHYTPWPCVRLSVCVWYNVWVGVLSKQLNNLSWFLAWKLLLRPILHCVVRQNKGTSVSIFVPNCGLTCTKFRHSKRIVLLKKTCQQSSLWITPMTVNISALLDAHRIVYYTSLNSNLLTQLLWFVIQFAPTVCSSWQDFIWQWHSTSLCGQRIMLWYQILLFSLCVMLFSS